MNGGKWSLLRDPELLNCREFHFSRLRSLFQGESSDRVFVLQGIQGYGKADLYSDPELWMEEALNDLTEKADRARDRVVFRPISVNPWPYGVHFIDRIFGAEVYELDGEKDNWQVKALKTPVGGLQPPDLDKSRTWTLARRLAEAFVDACVTVPLFAPPVLSSSLNIGLNLYGQELLCAMMSRPEAVYHDLRIINDVISALHTWYRETIPPEQLQMVETCGRIQPPGHGQLCGCSCQLISPGQYEDFVAPLDDEILSLYPNGGMIHLCGSHTQHIAVWRKMRSLRALQLNDRAAHDLETYYNELRDDQVFYVNPCTGMPVDRIMEITGGRRVVIVDNVTEALPTRSQKQEVRSQGGP